MLALIITLGPRHHNFNFDEWNFAIFLLLYIVCRWHNKIRNTISINTVKYAEYHYHIVLVESRATESTDSQ